MAPKWFDHWTTWAGHLSGARCKWFAYGPADATATPSSLAPVKSRMVYHTQWTAEGSVFGAVSLWFFVCVWNISGTAERICAIFTRKTCLVWSVACTSLKVKGQGHQGQKRHFSAVKAACVQFMFGKTSLASSFSFLLPAYPGCPGKEKQPLNGWLSVCLKWSR